MDILAQKLGDGSGPNAAEKLHQGPTSSRITLRSDGNMIPAIPHRDAQMMETVDYAGLRKQAGGHARRLQARRDPRDHGPRRLLLLPRLSAPARPKNCDILGIAMFDSCESACIRPVRASRGSAPRASGQGHETTWGADHRHRDRYSRRRHHGRRKVITDTAPYGLGTYGSRSTPVAGGRGSTDGRKERSRPRRQMIAAYKLEVHEG